VTRQRPRLAGTTPYVLALGTIEPRKNLPRLVEAFDRVAAEVPELRLVVVGRTAWGLDAYARRFAALEPRPNRAARVVTGEAGRPDRGATALAYPSLDEGFGLPPLEAMT